MNYMCLTNQHSIRSERMKSFIIQKAVEGQLRDRLSSNQKNPQKQTTELGTREGTSSKLNTNQMIRIILTVVFIHYSLFRLDQSKSKTTANPSSYESYETFLVTKPDEQVMETPRGQGRGGSYRTISKHLIRVRNLWFLLNFLCIRSGKWTKSKN